MKKGNKFKIEADVIKLTEKSATKVVKSLRKDRYVKPEKGTNEKLYDLHYISLNNRDNIYVPNESYLVTVKNVSFIMDKSDIFPADKKK